MTRLFNLKAPLKKIILFGYLTFCLMLQLNAQHQGKIQGPFGDGKEKKIQATQEKCLDELDRIRIRTTLQKSTDSLIRKGYIQPTKSARKNTIRFDWPLRQNAQFNDPGYYMVSNYVDHNQRFPNQLSDYNCGQRSYDTPGGYNHKGVDIALWPYHWDMVEKNQVEVIAAAPGIIIAKFDGNYDRNCSLSGGQWNAVYIRHADGSQAWYGHLKKNSLTSKTVGSRVARGEYLGVVASSGNSTGPHLHFEVYDANNNLIDPYAGPCNRQNGSTSWWRQQKPYQESGINRIMTHHSAPNPYDNECYGAELHEQTSFDPGKRVYMAAYYTGQMKGHRSEWRVIQPNGQLYKIWTHTSPQNYIYNSYWYYYFDFPSDIMPGTWRIEIDYLDKTYKQAFSINGRAQENCQCVDPLATNICEDFESYNVGAISTQSDCWTTWSGQHNTAEEAIVSRYLGNQYLSFFKGGQQDAVFKLGERTSGKYKLSFLIWTFSGDRAYYNILHKFNPGGYYDEEWAQDVFFDGEGLGYLRTGGKYTTFGYTKESWVTVEQHFDLDNNSTTLFIDGKRVRQWPFNYQNTSTYGSKELSAINFYPINEEYEFYVENIEFRRVNSFSENKSLKKPLAYGMPAPVKNDVLRKVKVAGSGEGQPINIQVYPQPTTGILFIESDFEQPTDVKLEVVSMMGSVLFSTTKERVETIKERVDLSAYANGIYYIRLKTNNTLTTRQLSLMK